MYREKLQNIMFFLSYFTNMIEINFGQIELSIIDKLAELLGELS